MLKKRPRTKAQFIPMVGMKASYYDEDHDRYTDVVVDHIYRRNISAKVHYATGKKSNGFDVAVASLDFPLEPGVNERFKYFTMLCKMAFKGELNSLYACGKGGLGKSYTAQQVIDMLELEEEVDYIRIKGHTSAFAFFRLLRDNPDQKFILDDFDDAFRDKACANILKAVLDTYKVRRVSWLTTKIGSNNDRKEQSFDFTGSIIFLSNIPKNELDGAILSRSAVVDLYMTPAEVIERMHFLKDSLDVGGDLTAYEKNQVIELLDKYKNTVADLNIRTLRKAFIIYEKHKDLSLVRYQILNS